MYYHPIFVIYVLRNRKAKIRCSQTPLKSIHQTDNIEKKFIDLGKRKNDFNIQEEFSFRQLTANFRITK